MNKVIGTESHPDSLSFNAKLFSYFARFVLPVWNLLNALAPLIREIHQYDVRRHQNLPMIGLRTDIWWLSQIDTRKLFKIVALAMSALGQKQTFRCFRKKKHKSSQEKPGRSL